MAEEDSVVEKQASYKPLMSVMASNKVLSPLSHGVEFMCVNVKDEDAVSTCCVCCQILSCQADSQSHRQNTSKFHHPFVCSRMCSRVLDQALAFMQGFVLCKLVCDFLDQGRKSRQGANTEQSRRSANTEDSDYSSLSMRVAKTRAACSPITAKTSLDTRFRSSVVETSRGSRKAEQLEASLPPATESRTRRQRPRQLPTTLPAEMLSIQSSRPRQCTEVDSTVKEETAAPAVCKQAEVSDLAEDVDRHSASSDTSLRDSSVLDTHDVTSHSSDVSSSGGATLVESEKTPCGICRKEFKTRKSMEIHFNKNHKKPDVKKKTACRICGKLYSRKGLINHINNQHAGEKAVECEVCGERFFRSRAYYKHLKIVHNKLDGMCDICGKHFKYANALREHMRAHAGIRDLVCELCGKSFVRITSLCDHKKLSHGHGKRRKSMAVKDKQKRELKKKPSRPRPKLAVLQCRECKKTLSDIRAWRLHMEEHKLSRTNFCEICGKGFKTQASLHNHKQQHQEKKFHCDICSKPFTYKCNMKKHRETHSEDRPFACEFCQKTFKNEKALNEHKAMHIEDRQFKCHLCGKGFSRSNNLQRHVRTMHPGLDT
ncbi:hypothetical protein BaRGS_00014929 [Batillaria attramentaria]|uniref:C2H2-type domain-containing protein n=1 Tax=Batillaria attramentaria TaxID=370345 RepID=A0ABD0L3I6_9CAEN